MNVVEPIVEDRKKQTAAAGSVIGAVLASSCCIGPLVLVSLGISGAWIGNLSALSAFQPYFVTATIGFLGLGYWQVYRKPKVACEEGSYCASPTSDRIVKVSLGGATILVMAALSLDYWAPFFY
jgi:mercuric ion transport protein